MAQPALPFSFTIAQATPADIPRIGEVSTRAFDMDRNSQMKIMGQRHGAFAAGMVEGARANLEAERTVLLKAVDDHDGTIVGSVAWGFRGVTRAELLLDDDDAANAAVPPPQPAVPATEAEEAAGAAQEKQHAGDERGEEEEEEVPGAARIREFEALTGGHLRDFFAALSAGGATTAPPFLFVGGITVHPAYHRRGVGAALLRWGTERADGVGARCYVHASEAGWRLFRSHGFEEVDRLAVDLDEWAVGPPRPGLGVVGEEGVERWGTYTFRYGCREPARRAE